MQLKNQQQFSQKKLNIFDKLVKPKRQETSQPRGLSNYIRKMAKLGGDLARASDPPPGNLVVWRGFSRLNDINLGILLAKINVGNLKEGRTVTVMLDVLVNTFQISALAGHRQPQRTCGSRP
jgi:hypothetical protein